MDGSDVVEISLNEESGKRLIDSCMHMQQVESLI
jgi:hypothetical protein